MISNLINISEYEYNYDSLNSSSSFEGMFEYCTSLITMPDIYTILFGEGSCKKMFYNCISLRNVKNINLLKYDNQSFESMFENCISLTSTPSFDYHNIDLDEYFLQYPKDEYIFSNYLDYIISDYQNHSKILEEENIETIDEILFDIINYPGYYGSNSKKLFYSTFYNCTSLKNINDIYISLLSDYCFALTFANCTSLEEVNEVLFYEIDNNYHYYTNYAFSKIFYNCTSLRIVSKDFFVEPIPNNAYYIQYFYQSAFENCTSLIQAPDIISYYRFLNSYYINGLCQRMFANCTSLIESPELIFLNVDRYYSEEPSVFDEMFYNCSSLNKIYTNISYNLNNTYGFHDWVYGVSNSGTFYLNEDYGEWEERGSSFIPEGWNIVYQESPITIIAE